VSSEVEGRVDGGEVLSCSGWKHYSLWASSIQLHY